MPYCLPPDVISNSSSRCEKDPLTERPTCTRAPALSTSGHMYTVTATNVPALSTTSISSNGVIGPGMFMCCNVAMHGAFAGKHYFILITCNMTVGLSCETFTPKQYYSFLNA